MGQMSAGVSWVSARKTSWARGHQAEVRLPVTVRVWEFQRGGGWGGAAGAAWARPRGVGWPGPVGGQPLAIPHSSSLSWAGLGQPQCRRVRLVAGDRRGQVPHASEVGPCTTSARSAGEGCPSRAGGQGPSAGAAPPPPLHTHTHIHARMHLALPSPLLGPNPCLASVAPRSRLACP